MPRDNSSRKYASLTSSRAELMKDYERRTITRSYYLSRMGAISLDSDWDSFRVTKFDDPPSSGDPDYCFAPTPAHDDDTLSQTAQPSWHNSNLSSPEEDGPTPTPQSSTAPAKSKKKRQLCPICRKGFQPRLLHTYRKCLLCQLLHHVRCIRGFDPDNFTCSKCSTPSSSQPLASG